MGVDRGNERHVRAARAPQGSDLRVLEHGSNCLATVDADAVLVETARGDEYRKKANVSKEVCQRALTEKRTLGGRRRTPGW